MFPDKGWDELSFHGRSIAAEAAWRLDADKIVEIEIDDGLQGGAGGGVTQIVRQDVIPGGVFGLQGDKPGDRVMPSLCASAPVGWPPIANHRCWLLGRAARAIDLMSVSGPGNPGREVRPGLRPGPAKGTALGTSLSVFAASA